MLAVTCGCSALLFEGPVNAATYSCCIIPSSECQKISKTTFSQLYVASEVVTSRWEGLKSLLRRVQGPCSPQHNKRNANGERVRCSCSVWGYAVQHSLQSTAVIYSRTVLWGSHNDERSLDTDKHWLIKGRTYHVAQYRHAGFIVCLTSRYQEGRLW